MSHAQPADAKPQESPVKMVVWVVAGTIALVIGIILIAQFAIGSYGARSMVDDPAMTPEALAKRIGPVAKLQVEGAPAVAPAPQGPKVASVAAVASPPRSGKAVYDTACMACHMTGAAGAPKYGDKAAWAPRLKAGMDALYGSSLKGKGAMPPKGGNASLPDAEVKAAVDYMVAGSK